MYAPKDDPKHRESWRELYDHEELAGFEAFAGAGDHRLGFSIAPGLSMAYDDADDRDAARPARSTRWCAAGAALVVLAFDDIPFGGGPQGEAHARVTTWLRDHLDDRAELSVVPTEYVGIRPSPYLDALAAGTPDDVPDRVDRASGPERHDHGGRRRALGPTRSVAARRCSGTTTR